MPCSAVSNYRSNVTTPRNAQLGNAGRMIMQEPTLNRQKASERLLPQPHSTRLHHNGDKNVMQTPNPQVPAKALLLPGSIIAHSEEKRLVSQRHRRHVQSLQEVHHLVQDANDMMAQIQEQNENMEESRMGLVLQERPTAKMPEY